LSLGRVLKILYGFGFSRVDTEVYVYLAKTGPQNGKDLAAALKMSKQQLYLSLKSLKEKGAITSNLEHNRIYSALAFEELLKAYIELNEQQAEIIKQTKKELLKSWKNMKN
jgi:sugar-specific transcriptional regulator TrmB